MNLQFLKSFSNGRDVMDRQYPTHFSEIDSVLRLAGLGTPLSEIAKYLLRFQWTALDADQRSFAKGRVKVDLWHELPCTGTATASGAYDAWVIVALSPALRGLAALNQLAQRANLTSTPTVVVAPCGQSALVSVCPFIQALKNIGSPKGSEFRIGNAETTPAQETRVRALISQARNLKTKTGQLTQGALLVRTLEENGLAMLVAINPDFKGGAGGETAPVDENGTMYGTAEKAQRGESTCARITIYVNAPDAVSSFVHEVTHAAQFITGFGHYGDPVEEWEPTRIGNEAYEAIGYGYKITDTYKRQGVPEWNRYIPWVTIAPQHF